MTYTLARPSLVGDMLGPPVKGFLTGMMLLAGMILLAACANLGSLFAARAADRSREVALRLALGSSSQAHSARSVYGGVADLARWRGVGALRQCGGVAAVERLVSGSRSIRCMFPCTQTQKSIWPLCCWR